MVDFTDSDDYFSLLIYSEILEICGSHVFIGKLPYGQIVQSTGICNGIGSYAGDKKGFPQPWLPAVILGMMFSRHISRDSSMEYLTVSITRSGHNGTS
jgi:hypothetical protein